MDGRRENTVIGLDPGSRKTGWGVLREQSGVISLLNCGVIRPKAADFSSRLGEICSELRRVLQEFQPDEAAIENLFTCKNIASALKLGQARGAAVGICSSMAVRVFDYEPALIKKNLTGNGRAEKKQVSFMVGRLLGVKENWAEDAGDALAAAICHLNMRRMRKFNI
ncbi:MAG: crossover junction endodeoxyribonuclease RuvC [Desulfovibrionaceae bacterium]|nr:crossover junction endodeoxyribonuclease RuvC [Desulfovibrionaceae bacterium]